LFAEDEELAALDELGLARSKASKGNCDAVMNELVVGADTNSAVGIGKTPSVVCAAPLSTVLAPRR
jgi:hypothetical protein